MSHTASEDSVRLTLPWPAKALNPNGRSHYMVKARATKLARLAAWGLTLEATRGRKPGWGGVALHWHFQPKTRNAVDSDNAQGACKAYRDGIADALGIDDSKFVTTYSIGAPVKGGAVIVTLRAA